VADRTVTVVLAANVAPYVGPMAAATAATKGVSTATTGVGTAATQATGPVGKLGKAAGVMGTGFSAVGLGATAAGIVVGKFAMDSIGAASDLAESQNKVSVVFGKSAGAVRDFGEDAAGSLGMSENAAISAAATFGQFFDEAGLSGDAAADMSMDLVALASDLASFNNIDPSTALQKLRSGLAGEAEPLRVLGVFLSEAEVKAKAMELGLVGAHGELSQGAKIQARYALIMEQTTKAQGDFERTSDGLANKQRILSAGVVDLQAKIGQQLTPALSQMADAAIVAVDALGGLLGGIDDVNEASKSWTEGDGLITVIQNSIPGLGAMKQGAENLGSAMEALGLKTEDATELTAEQQAAQDRNTEASYRAREASGQFADQTKATQKAIAVEVEELDDLRDAYFKTMNAALGLSDATIGYEQALDDATASIKENGTTLDINTQKGRDNRTALDNIARAALGVEDQMYETGASEAEVATKNAIMRNSLYNAALQFGMTEQEAHDYTDRVLGIPATASTTPSFNSAQGTAAIAAYLEKLQSLPKTVESNILATYTSRYQGGTGGPMSAFAGSGNRVFPLPGGKGAYRVTQGLHPVNAIDYGAASGTPVFASFSGYLITGNLGSRSYGKYYRLSGSGQRPILGAHLSAFSRNAGPIAKGEQIGWTGSTGNSTGPHLHLENFDTGGILGHGSAAFNASGRPERILNPAQTESFDKLVTVLAGGRGGGGGSIIHYHYHFPNYVGSRSELVREMDSLRRQGRA